MDALNYSQETSDSFIKNILCNGDALLYHYVKQGDVKKFRSRASRIVPAENIERVVYALVTNSLRDVIMKIISILSQYLKPYGDMIITGGEAFNTFFEPEDKMVTIDIDTKFVPIFRTGKSKVMTSRDPRYFGYLQATKLLLWDKLGSMMPFLNKIIAVRMKELSRTRLARMIGLTGGDATRRYTLIRKKKQSKYTNNVIPKDVLIDVELFAIDMTVRYFSVETRKLQTTNLGGILDIAFMRPGELGYEIAYSRKKGIYVYNRGTNKWKYDKNLLVASKQFLLDDLYTMQSLGLRPEKREKDRERMYKFAKNVLKINVKRSDSLFEIFKKSGEKIKPEPFRITDRPFCPECIINQARKINPNKYSKYTTEPIREKVLRLSIGIKGPKNLTINKFSETLGKHRFDTRTKKWVVNKSTSYIKNEYNYRPNKNYNGNMKSMAPLYGYNPVRNKWIPSNLIQKSARIPFVGLKNKTAKK